MNVDLAITIAVGIALGGILFLCIPAILKTFGIITGFTVNTTKKTITNETTGAPMITILVSIAIAVILLLGLAGNL